MSQFVQRTNGIASDDLNPQIIANSPAKRSFLRDCIAEIYLLKGTRLPRMEFTADFNNRRIHNMLDELVRPRMLKAKHASVERIRRQLFRQTQKSRKSSSPLKKTAGKETQGFNFRAIRDLLGVKYIRRNFQSNARSIIMESEAKSNLKRKHSECDFMHDDGEETFTQICKFHCNAQKQRQLHDQCIMDSYARAARTTTESVDRQSDHMRYVNERALEESVRSIYYLKALLTVTIENDDIEV